MESREEIKRYEPDFTPHDWTDNDRLLLEPFATSLDGFVSVLRNLPPEIVGALCSRASRAKGSLLKVLLKEYIKPIIEGEDRELAEELKSTVNFLKDHGFRKILNNQRAQAFYARWLSQYGDDSIAQMTGTHVVLWGVSQVAMKFCEDQRIGLEPIEKSTRYVNFGEKIGGRYLYYIPKLDLERLGLLEEYQETLDHLFDTYTALLPPLIKWFQENFNEKRSILEKKAFDTLRGLLPMATLGQVAFRGNAQAFEYLINRSIAHPLGELRYLAHELKRELDNEIPSLILRVNEDKSREYQAYLNGRYKEVEEFIREKKGELLEKDSIRVGNRPEVNLVEYDPETEVKILAGILFKEIHGSWDQTMAIARGLNEKEKEELFRRYLKNRRARWYKVGRAFENSYLRYDIVMDIGAYRDLHRHRMLTQERQRFSTHHGFNIPGELKEAGLADRFTEALGRARGLFEKIESDNPDLAQYAVPMAYRMRFYQWQNIRQLFWETELRTISQGHPDYRFIEQEKYRLFREKFPILSRYLMVDMKNYALPRRGTEERIKKKEERIKKELADKNKAL